MSEVVPVGAWSNRPRVLLGLGLFWAGEALLGVGLGVVMVSEGRGMPGWMLGVALFFAVFLAAVGLPGYSVSLMGTDADAVAVAKAMHGWHVAARAGASAAGADPA